MTPRFSIILPCYNEAETLPALFAGFAQAIGGRDDLEVIFVNNGSADSSAGVFARECARAEYRFARVVNVPKNLGYGHGIWSGLLAARGQFVGWTHADSQYEPRIVIEGFARLVAQPDAERCFLQGLRVGRNWFDGLFTGGMTVLARLLLGAPVRDINAQPKLFPRALLAEMRDPPQDFSFDLYALVVAHQGGYRTVGLPVVFGQRLHGEAKGGGSFALKWKLTKRTWTFMLELRRKLRAAQA